MSDYVHSFDDGPSEIDESMPAPLLMNCWKHHAGVIHQRIADHVAGGEPLVRELPDRLRQIGNALMDLYLGALAPEAIAAQTLAQLEATGVRDGTAWTAWLDETGGYRTIELDDTSRWVLRNSPVDGRHVHIHPARYSPHSVRVRANLLRSAIVTLAWAGLHGLRPADVETVNAARVELLELAPVKKVSPDEGLGELLARLAACRP